jgi:cell division protease FtsH
MSERFGLIGLTTVEDQYLGGHAALNCGEATAAEIDQEVMRVLKEAYDKALALLRENREALDKIADFLIQKETITGKEFMQILREVKGMDEAEKVTVEAGEVTAEADSTAQTDETQSE